MNKTGYVYLMMNKTNTVIYAGVTSNLKSRAYKHRNMLIGGFTSKYHVIKLVYYEIHSDMRTAITREKQIKAGSRAKKLALITEKNPEYKDLYDGL